MKTGYAIKLIYDIYIYINISDIYVYIYMIYVIYI